MFSSVARLASSAARGFLLNGSVVRPGTVAAGQATRGMSHGSTESDEDFDARYEAFFNKPDIDGWEIRKAMNDLCGMDLIPEPKIINAALRACRRVNDYSLAVRFLEALRFKCGHLESTIYPYIIQEVTPTLNELGIDTPEKLGYDKPELALKSVYDM